ncbi:hypothetical protein ACTHQX_11360 [Arthrobacter sp. SAFR-023]|uniref:hypothetical protein n=1 Tax=Arthrobacter sp. FW305-BF8 TaxID=2879617 RepID=UPI001F3B730B|nr:hypothetical protein [Arthrobacter sp. FW305-BF8]UKA56131.1 hypothetical protein LFT45_09580 [Arthrobacter sp. FW305-BF8]
MKNTQGSRHLASGNLAKKSQRHAVDAGATDEGAGRHRETHRRNPVKAQKRGKGNRARFFSGHVAQATDIHELVTKDAPPIGKACKEAPGHQ